MSTVVDNTCLQCTSPGYWLCPFVLLNIQFTFVWST